MWEVWHLKGESAVGKVSSSEGGAGESGGQSLRCWDRRRVPARPGQAVAAGHRAVSSLSPAAAPSGEPGFRPARVVLLNSIEGSCVVHL